MRGGEVPIHIQRWAPADFQADEHVRFWLFERDYEVYVFYRQFIDVSFIQGGDLPADPRRLAAVLSLPLEVVEKGLAECVGTVVHEDGDRLYQKRVRGDIEKELAFREKQAAAGKKSGKVRRKKAAKRRERSSDDGTSNTASTVVQSGLNQTRTKREPNANPPAPAPTPAPTPKKEPPTEGAELPLGPVEVKPSNNPAAESVRKVFETHGVPEALWPSWPIAGKWAKEWNGDGGPGVPALIAALETLAEQGHLGRGFAWVAKILPGWLAYGGKEPPGPGGGGRRSSPDLERRKAGHDPKLESELKALFKEGGINR